jgi:anaerobic carbon-monoxide dehydrogenase iron sulfur subunit
MRRIVTRSEVCSGCRACEIACVVHHEGGFGTALSRIKVTKVEPEGLDSPSLCRLCRRPACAAACPVRALTQDEATGTVRLDPEACLGCGDCAAACPFGMVTLRGDGLPLMCDLCDGDPSCVKRCATGAIRLRDEAAPSREKREARALRALEDRPGTKREHAGGAA